MLDVISMPAQMRALGGRAHQRRPRRVVCADDEADAYAGMHLTTCSTLCPH